ncbi:MAG: hypothetical protein E7214_04390 [Clostridium sp.]|nr:hypothetical protein [Clostridium sp.]
MHISKRQWNLLIFRNQLNSTCKLYIFTKFQQYPKLQSYYYENNTITCKKYCTEIISKVGRCMKNNKKILAIVLSILMLTLMISSNTVKAAESINIPDNKLRTVILESIGKSADDNITEEDIKSIEKIDLDDYKDLKDGDKIKSIEGLQYAANLKELDLSNNEITDISFIKDLKNIYKLDLSNNKISDINSLSNLVNLKILYMNNNSISDISSLSKLGKLRILYLNDNKVADLSALGQLENLYPKFLKVYNQVVDLKESEFFNDFEFVNPVTSLDNTKVDSISNISDNGIYDKDTNTLKFSGLKESKTLTYSFNEDVIIGNEKVNFSGVVNKPVILKQGVNIPDDNLRSAIIKALGKDKEYVLSKEELSTITNLQADDMNIESIEGLQYCTSLKDLSLAENKITDIYPLSNLVNLVNLKLKDNNISDLTPISKLINLDFLNLYGNNISDLKPLANITNLKILSLPENNISDLAPLSKLVNLSYLNLFGNNISDISPLRTLEKLTNVDLRMQAIRFNSIVTKDTFTLKNPLLDEEGNKINSINSINYNGVYNSEDGTIKWNNIKGDRILQFNFIKDIEIGNATGMFSGVVVQPIKYIM